MHNRTQKTVGMMAIVLLFGAASSYAFLDFSGSNIALGRTHSVFNRGAWVGRWNPSLLDRPGAPIWSMELLSFGVLVGNNTLSRGDYQRLFTGDNEFWDTNDKEEILSEIPGNALRGHFAGNFTGLALSVNRFALNVYAVGAGRIGIPKDFMRLALYGNELNREYSFEEIEGTGWGALSVDVSVGKTLPWEFFDQFAVGGTFRYMYGLGYAGVDKADGGVTVTETGVNGRGDFEFGYGTTGDGVGLDLAASALWNEKWEFGVTLGNIIGTLTWDLDSTNVYGFDITNGEIDIDSLDNEDYLDNLFNQVDTTYSGGTAKSRMPFYFQPNAGYRINEKLIATAEFQQGFAARPGVSKIPRLSVAGEYRPLPWLPLRSGMAIGGSFAFEWGIGFGLDFNSYNFDLGVIGLKGIFGSSHGVGIGFTNRFMF